MNRRGMKTMYWRAGRLPQRTLVGLCLLALGGVAAAEWTGRLGLGDSARTEKLAAAQLAAEGMAAIKAERTRRGHEFDPQFDPQFDPAGSGLIGEYRTETTSVPGHLGSKQTSINPNFAAVVVDMLHEAGVKKGDVVAVGCSGSFPAINLCVAAALETMQARPIVIASAAASQYGANRPDFLWIDMERHLHENGLISHRSVAASYGGSEDQAAKMTDGGRAMLAQSIERNGLPTIPGDDYDATLDARMAVYERHAAGRPVKAYINIGGGAVSTGRSVGKALYEPGLNLEASAEALAVDSVMTRFARRGTPVLHFSSIPVIAEKYGLPVAPAQTPAVGEGNVYRSEALARSVAGGMLLLVLTTLARAHRRQSAAEQAATTIPFPQPAAAPQSSGRRAA